MVVVIKMRGLPFESSAREIREFFYRLEIKEEEIHLAPNENGKASGVAFAVFHNDDDARKAMFRDGQYLGKRYVNLFLSSVQEMEKILREGVQERKKGFGPKRPSEQARSKQERGRSDSEQSGRRENERGGRISRNQGEIRSSNRSRSRSPMKANDREVPRSRPTFAESHGPVGANSQSGLRELKETQRGYETEKSFGLLSGLSDYEKLELGRQILAAEAKSNRDLDLRYLLMGQQHSAASSLPHNSSDSHWKFPQNYESHHMRMIPEGLRDDHVRVVELLNQSQNTEPLIHGTGSEAALAQGVSVFQDPFNKGVGSQNNYPVGITSGYSYPHERVGEISGQNLGEKAFTGHDFNFGLEKINESQVHSSEKIQEGYNRADRTDGHHNHEGKSGRVEDGRSYQRSVHKGHVRGQKKGIEGQSYTGKHKRNSVGIERKNNHGNYSKTNRKTASEPKSNLEKGAKHHGHGKVAERTGGHARERRTDNHGSQEYGNTKHSRTYERFEGNQDDRTSRRQGREAKRHRGNDDENDEARGFCVNMIGLPYSSTEEEVEKFFKGLRVKDVHRCRNLSGPHTGKTNGEAFVIFHSFDDCMKAVEQDRQLIRDRFVKVRKCPKEVMYDAVQKEAKFFGKKPRISRSVTGDGDIKDSNQIRNSQMKSDITSGMQMSNKLPSSEYYPISQPGQDTVQPTVYGYASDSLGRDVAMSQLAQGANINMNDIKAGCVVGIRNLPSTVTADEILDFFYGFKIIPDSIRIHYLAPGRSSGDAIVTFVDEKEARIATQQLNEKAVGRRNVQLFPV